MRFMGRTIKRALLTSVSWCWAETTHASRVCYGANVVSLGGNIKRSTAKLHGYSHVRVARNYDLNVNQLASLMVDTVTSVLDHRLPSGDWAEPGILL